MIDVDYKKFTPEKIQECERSALYRAMGYLEAVSKYPESYTKEEIKLTQTILSKMEKELSPVLKS